MTMRIWIAGGLAAVALGGSATAQTVPGPYGPTVTLAQARQALAAAEAEAARRHFTMAFAVVEPSGELVAFDRMDGVQYGSIAVAQAKGRTAARFRRPSKAFAEAMATKPGVLSLDGVVAVEGGVPIVVDGKVIGALGVSGGSSEEDGQIAQAGVAAVR